MTVAVKVSTEKINYGLLKIMLKSGLKYYNIRKNTQKLNLIAVNKI